MMLAESSFEPLATLPLTSQGNSEYPVFEGLSSLPTPSEWLNAVDLNHCLSSGEWPYDMGLEAVPIDQSLDQVLPSKFAPSIDFLGTRSSVEQYQAPFAAEDYFSVLSPAAGSSVAFPARPDIQPGPISPLSRASTIFTWPEQPQRNSNGEIICDHLNCSGKNTTFTSIRDWS